jgi:hypothetical protein
MDAALLTAHVGHWWMWGIYAVPFAVVLVATVRSFIQQRREGR